MKSIDISNQKFGRLTAIQRYKIPGKPLKWECICECGNKTYVVTRDLITGHTRSCGCYNKENQIAINTTHGMKNTRIYNTWCHMKRRCINTKDSRYNAYGGRGITVCDRWLKFENFYEDMKDGYSDNLTLDRIDNDKGYLKENCRWATIEEQCNNKCINRIITIDGISDTLANFTKKFNIDYSLVSARLSRGWNAEDALLKKPRKMVTKIYTVDGITGTVAALARHFNINKVTVFYRLSNNWDIDDALKIKPIKGG